MTGGTVGRGRGSSTVVGSLLLIAVVAVSTTVVGGTGLMRSMEEEPPSASIEMEFEGDTVVMTYFGPESLDGTELDTAVTSGSLTGPGWPDTVEPGTTVTFTHDGGWDGERVSVFWTATDGRESQILVQVSAPDAEDGTATLTATATATATATPTTTPTATESPTTTATSTATPTPTPSAPGNSGDNPGQSGN